LPVSRTRASSSRGIRRSRAGRSAPRPGMPLRTAGPAAGHSLAKSCRRSSALLH
jgi:hypothetical protein